MTSHRRVALVALVLCVLAAPSLSAQFGGLKKKAAKAVGAETGVAPAPAKATPPPEVTPVIVDHYLAGIKAGKEQRDRLAQSNTPAGKYYAAVDAKKAHDTHCEELIQSRQTEYQRLVAAKQYDSANAMIQKRDASCDSVTPSPDQPAFEELTKAQGSQDSAAAAGAGLEVSQWAGLNEWIPMMVYQMLNSPDQNDQLLASNFSKKVSEVQAIRARQADLAKALGVKGPEKKEAPPPVVVMAPPAAAGAAAGAQGDPACYQAEMNKNQAAIEAFGARAEDARKKGDNQKMMALADSMSQVTTAAMRKCGMIK